MTCAILTGALGIATTEPVGRSRRTCYVVAAADGGEPFVKAGCWWGRLSETLTRIEREYEGSDLLGEYVEQVKSAAGRL